MPFIKLMIELKHTMLQWMRTMPRMFVVRVLVVLILVGCGPSPSAGSPDASANTIGSASEVMTPAAIEREASGDAGRSDTSAHASGRGRVASQATPAAFAPRTSSPAAPTPTPTPDPDERRIPPPISYDGYPCDPYVIDALERWFWENTVRWAADGSAVFFSQGPAV